MTYCGTLVQGRTTKPTFKCKKSKPVDKENWVVANDTHDAIIPLSHFKAVERLLELETRISPSQKTVYPLSGMVRCGKCGDKMTRKVKSTKSGKYPYLVCCNKADKSCDTSICKNDGTVDGCHPTDFGFVSMAKALGDLIEKLDLV